MLELIWMIGGTKSPKSVWPSIAFLSAVLYVMAMFVLQLLGAAALLTMSY